MIALRCKTNTSPPIAAEVLYMLAPRFDGRCQEQNPRAEVGLQHAFLLSEKALYGNDDAAAADAAAVGHCPIAGKLAGVELVEVCFAGDNCHTCCSACNEWEFRDGTEVTLNGSLLNSTTLRPICVTKEALRPAWLHLSPVQAVATNRGAVYVHLVAAKLTIHCRRGHARQLRLVGVVRPCQGSAERQQYYEDL